MSVSKVLIVDDEPVQLRLTAAIAEKAGFTVLTASGGEEALSLLLGGEKVGAVVLDLVMPDIDGMTVLETVKQRGIDVPVIIQTASSGLETVISAMRLGAADFFIKPVAPERLTISLRNAMRIGELEVAVRNQAARLSGQLKLDAIIASAPAMQRPIELTAKAARSNIPVLIEGETGVGKELFARAIHGSGERAGKPFIALNCGAIPSDLVESTLFGHIKGAFTGAHADHAGKFTEANGGTLFLDEVGELPPAAQVKLLRALQEGEVEPVGATKPVKVNVRVISATNRRLLSMAANGSFREDLYYRLNVFPIYVPPLRERTEDIAPLTEHFLARFAAETGKGLLRVGEPARDLLGRYDWPGNIRQLENAVYRAVVLAESDELTPRDFPQIAGALSGRERLRRADAAAPVPAAPVHVDAPLPDWSEPSPHTDLDDTGASSSSANPAPASGHKDRFLDPDQAVKSLAEVERELILFAIRKHRGHMSQVARTLGIGRSTLYRKFKEYGIELQPELASGNPNAA